MSEYNILNKSINEKMYVIKAENEYEAKRKALDIYKEELEKQGVHIQHVVQKTVSDQVYSVISDDIFPYILDEYYERFFIESDGEWL